MTFEEVKEMFKKSIDATDTMNQAIENLIQSIYLKGYNDAFPEKAQLSGKDTTSDLISRQRLLKKLKHHKELFCRNRIEFLGLSKNDKARADEIDSCIATVINMPPAQPQYTELTPEEVASEIASGSIMSASYWLDTMIRLKQMGYAICRKKG